MLSIGSRETAFIRIRHHLVTSDKYNRRMSQKMNCSVNGRDVNECHIYMSRCEFNSNENYIVLLLTNGGHFSDWRRHKNHFGYIPFLTPIFSVFVWWPNNRLSDPFLSHFYTILRIVSFFFWQMFLSFAGMSVCNSVITSYFTLPLRSTV